MAEPYRYIKDENHSHETLRLIEALLEEAEDSVAEPINTIIDFLSGSIETYENKDNE